MRYGKKLLFILLALISLGDAELTAQSVYQPVRHPVYDFLNRIEARYGVALLQFVRPLPRDMIALALDALSKQGDRLRPYDREELDFYRMEFAEELLRRQGSDSTIESPVDERWNLLRLRFDVPVKSFAAIDLFGQISYTKRQDADDIFERSNGVQVYGYVGNELGASMRWYDNGLKGLPYDQKSRRVARQGIVKGPGSGDSYEWEVAEGQFNYSNGWLRAGVQKMDLWRGSGRNGSIILSDKAPSFPAIAFQIQISDWLQFDYFHGWLMSDIEFWTPYQKFFETKYLASHSVTVRPFRNLQASLGESIIYGGTDVNILFLIPVISFRAADRWTRATAGNSQFFADVRYTPVQDVTVYATGFIDELDLSKALSGEKVNFNYHLAYTLGAFVTDVHYALIPIASETRIEFTRIFPHTYTNTRPAQNYTSHQVYLGHWLGQNADGVTARHTVHPWRGWDISVEGAYYRFGASDQPVVDEIQAAFLYGYEYSQSILSAEVAWTPLHDLTGKVSATHVLNKRGPEFTGALPTDGLHVTARISYSIY